MKLCISPFVSKPLIVVSILLNTFAWAGPYHVLHRFQKNPIEPTSGLVSDAAGNLYGSTAQGGGPSNAGTIYQLSPTNGFHVIHVFKGTDGAGPWGNLIFDSEGNLYGTTSGGGTAPCPYQRGCGTVYRLSPSNDGGAWTETVLYNFTGQEDGGLPEGGVIMDSSGVLYGTTNQFGALNCGVVFSLTPVGNDQWTNNVLYTFTGDGCNPQGRLIFDSSGNLYGAAPRNGVWNGGTVFQLSPMPDGSWMYDNIHEFNPNVKDGYFPGAGLIIDKEGNLYGTTEAGGAFGLGTVFELTLTGGTWAEKLLYHFAGGSDGETPEADLVFDTEGNLYSTTYAGGGQSRNCQYGCGTIFRLTPEQDGTWTEERFALGSGAVGAEPQTPVILDNAGHLFGTTFQGGFINGIYAQGVAFQLNIGKARRNP